MKRFFRAFVCLVSVLMLLTACGKTSDKTTSDAALDGDYSSYITLGEYKGLTVSADIAPITEDDIEELREEYLSNLIKYTEKMTPAEYGDLVGINIVCRDKSENGEILYDFSDGYDLTIGDGDFSYEFDEELIGKSTGDSFECVLAIPEETDDSIIAGKDVYFSVSVESVSAAEVPELTDESYEQFGVSSEAEFEEMLLEELKESRSAEYVDDLKLRLVNAVIDNSKIDGVDKKMYEASLESLKQEYQSMADMFGIDIKSLYESLDITEESIAEDAKRDCYEKMAIALIAKAEGLSISDEEFDDLLLDYVIENGYESVDEVYEEYTAESLRDYFLEEKVIDFLYENAVIK